MLLAGLLLTAGFLLTAWLLFQHVPSWYRPVVIAAGEAQRVRNDLLGTQDVLTESVRAGQTFRYVFSQQRVNEWLAVREAVWPESRNWLPKGLSDPFIAIDEQGVRLAATYRHGGLRTVVSAQLGLVAEEGGIRVQLLDVTTGDLSLPDSWIRHKLEALDAGGWPTGRTIPYQHGNQPLPPLSGLFEGLLLPREWIMWTTGQPFRITGLDLAEGALTVAFEPLARQPGTR